MAAVALFTAVDFGRRVAAIYRLRREKARLEQEIAQEEARREELEAYKGYVQSDEFVEQWARTEGKMVKPGETPVVPVPVRTPTLSEKHPPEESQAAEGAHWREWWELFFGSEFKRRPGDSHLFGTGGSQKMARYSSLSVFPTSRSRVTVTWVNSLKSPAACRADLTRKRSCCII